jgi:hypothetical protein
MSDLREAAQALVDRWDTPLWKDAPHTGQYIDALRAALAQAEQEPCGWGCFMDGVLMENLVSDEKSVDYWCASKDPEMHGLTKKPLYTYPPQRKPLNGDEMLEVLKTFYFDGTVEFGTIVRAIEKAHGIGGEHG